jgi:hypothetical protein
MSDALNERLNKILPRVISDRDVDALVTLSRASRRRSPSLRAPRACASGRPRSGRSCGRGSAKALWARVSDVARDVFARLIFDTSKRALSPEQLQELAELGGPGASLKATEQPIDTGTAAGAAGVVSAGAAGWQRRWRHRVDPAGRRA